MANRVFSLFGGSLFLLVVGVVGKLLYSSDETVSMGSVVLIIVGAPGMNIGWLLMGSVAEQVMRRATCPVLTVKTPPRSMSSSEEVVTAEAGKTA